MVRSGKAGPESARRRAGARRTHPSLASLAEGKDTTAAGAQQGLPSDPGELGVESAP